MHVFYHSSLCRYLIVASPFISGVSHNLKQIHIKMPKEVKHTAVLQKQRQKLKEKNQKYIPGTVNLRVLGSGAKGAPRSLYVFTDQSRYMFNCGEGTQRLAHEHKMKLSKLEHIFITNKSWNNIGGLPGVALTIQDVGVPVITIHGPSGTDDIFNATRRFVVLKDMTLKMADCSPSNFFEDNVMRVNYVPIDAQNSVSDAHNIASEDVSGNNNESSSDDLITEDDIDYYAYERKNKIALSSEEAPRKRKNSEPISHYNSKDSKVVMCYICQLQTRPGTLCLEKCVERGVPPGPLLGKLKAGEDIVLADGTTVLSSDVKLPDDPGPVFIVVECPSLDYIENLVNNPILSRHQVTASKEEDTASLIVHFTPQNVMNDSRYKQWMEKFSMSCQHLILNEENSCMGSTAVHRIQYKLNLLHSGLFPLLGDKSIATDKNMLDSENSGESEVISSNTTNNMKDVEFCTYRGQTLDCVHLRPRTLWEREGLLSLTPKIYLEEVYVMDGFSDTLKDVKEQMKQISGSIVSQRRGPRITFLGTGSSIPNKTRNTSGILLHLNDSECILMDCGEGTWGQIVRLYGPEKADLVLLGMKAIYISHLHADHHIGLIGLLKARRAAIERNTPTDSVKPIYLFAPQQIMSWLSHYHWNFEPITQEILLVQNGLLDLKKYSINEELERRILRELNMSVINTVRVRHCPNAFGVAFSHKDNWKLTYSGDTMPCYELVELGKYSDVLIHEATMEDELVDEARVKQHSTTSQAIDIGRKMEAKFTLLTHFSQRYAKIPLINENFSSNVGIAFDNMQVYLHELPLLPLIHPVLKIIFQEHYDEMEQKTFRRLMKQEREKKSEAV